MSDKAKAAIAKATTSDDQEMIDNLEFLQSYDVLEDETDWESIEKVDDDDGDTDENVDHQHEVSP